jgi:hypothetical protein
MSFLFLLGLANFTKNCITIRKDWASLRSQPGPHMDGGCPPMPMPSGLDDRCAHMAALSNMMMT